MGNKSKRRSQTHSLKKPNREDVINAPEKKLLYAREESFSGPIPAPETLGRYDEIMPGLADRIVKMAEQQGAHRRQLEQQSVEAQIADARADRSEARIGQICALLIGLVATLAGSYTAWQGAEWPGGIIGGGGVIGLVSVFILGRKRSSEPAETTATS